MSKKRLSITEVADRLGVSTTTVIAAIDDGRLPAINVAAPSARRRTLRVLEADLQQFESASHCTPAAPHPVRARPYRMRHLHA